MTARHAMKAALGAVVVSLVLTCGIVPAQEKKAEGKNLYQRLGGYDAIAAVTDDFIGRLTKDPQIAPFFKGHSMDTLRRIRQLAVDQICAVTGGPCYYIGRDMKTTHAGLGISQADWDLSVKHLVASLEAFSVPTAEKDELLAAVSTLKDDIVEKH